MAVPATAQLDVCMSSTLALFRLADWPIGHGMDVPPPRCAAVPTGIPRFGTLPEVPYGAEFQAPSGLLIKEHVVNNMCSCGLVCFFCLICQFANRGAAAQ